MKPSSIAVGWFFALLAVVPWADAQTTADGYAFLDKRALPRTTADRDNECAWLRSQMARTRSQAASGVAVAAQYPDLAQTIQAAADRELPHLQARYAFIQCDGPPAGQLQAPRPQAAAPSGAPQPAPPEPPSSPLPAASPAAAVPPASAAAASFSPAGAPAGAPAVAPAESAPNAPPAVAPQPTAPLTFDQCFAKCRELTDRTKAQCFDACRH